MTNTTPRLYYYSETDKLPIYPYTLFFSPSEGGEEGRRHCWELKTELDPIPESVIDLTCRWYTERANRHYDISAPTRNEIAKMLNLEDIISKVLSPRGGGLIWEDTDYLQYLHDAMETGAVPIARGYSIPSGAIVLDQEWLDIVYHGIDEADQ